jgi:hypothetical protein
MSAPDAELLEELNDEFIRFYEDTRTALVEAQKRVALIVINGDQMLFFHRGGEPRVLDGLRPPIYTKLKALAHVPLAIFALLTLEAGDAPLSCQTALRLSGYRHRLRLSAAALDVRCEVDSGTLPGPITIYDRSLAFSDGVVTRGSVSAQDLHAFVAGLNGEIKALFATAAKAQIDAVHAEMSRLKEDELSSAEWDALRVVVMGPHMAHKDDLFLQYFSRLLRTPMYAEKRLVYFEGADEQGALDLLGTTMIDMRAARAFFADEFRLHRDILGDATDNYLRELFPDDA